jgi:hypothetical protein
MRHTCGNRFNVEQLALPDLYRLPAARRNRDRFGYRHGGDNLLGGHHEFHAGHRRVGISSITSKP